METSAFRNGEKSKNNKSRRKRSEDRSSKKKEGTGLSFGCDQT